MDRLPGTEFEIHRADTWCAGLLALLALHILYMSSDLAFGTISRPGPGLFPISLSVLLLAFAAILFVKSGFRSDVSRIRFQGRVAYVCLSALAITAYGGLLEWIGFPIITTLLLLLMFRVVSEFSWSASAVLAMGGTAAVFILFRLLGVILPVGSLWT
jgi:putative tricarboxylic transport membrane protein